MSINSTNIKAARDGAAAIMSATMFLSRLPLNSLAERFWLDISDVDFAKSARYFSIAGFIIALPAALLLWPASYFGLSPTLAAIIAATALVITTGALHEDALADVADGFGGGNSVDKKLAIMRDSQIGSYGASALILSFALYIACITQLLSKLGAGNTAMILIAANVAATSLMVWPWATLPAARTKGGLSADHGIPGSDTAIAAVILGMAIAFILLWFAAGIIQAIISLAIGYGVMFAFSSLCRRQIGGQTGDTLGATKKISELGLLLALIIAT